MTAVDLVVVGAGPAGASLAASMARAGASVLLLERAQHPRPKACAEYASPRIVEELARIGLRDAAWADTAVPLDAMELHAGGHRVRLGYADRSGPRSAWGLDRRAFDERLARHAETCGAHLRERAAAIELLEEGGRVQGVRVRGAATGQEERVKASWVVGADGVRSTVSRLLGVDRRVAFPRRLGLIAHYTGTTDLNGHGEMHVGAGGYVGLAPTPNGELNVGMALPLAAAGSSRHTYESMIAGIPAVARRLERATRVTPIRGAAPIGHRVARVAGPGWLLVGDAAGFVDPFTGEGIHRALRSSRAAASALLGGGDIVAAYETERRRAFAAKSALSWLVQAFLATPALLEHAVARLERRPLAAARLASALGDCRPATHALSPRALWEVLGP